MTSVARDVLRISSNRVCAMERHEMDSQESFPTLFVIHASFMNSWSRKWEITLAAMHRVEHSAYDIKTIMILRCICIARFGSSRIDGWRLTRHFSLRVMIFLFFFVFVNYDTKTYPSYFLLLSTSCQLLCCTYVRRQTAENNERNFQQHTDTQRRQQNAMVCLFLECTQSTCGRQRT